MHLYISNHVAAKCPALTVINGLISYTPDISADFDIGTQAYHDCDYGYTLSGATVLTCTQGNPNDITGVWDLPFPTCDCE